MMGVLLLSLVIVLSVFALGLWVVQLVRRHRGATASLRVALVVTVVAVDGWFWAIAFDSAFGPDRSLRGPVVFVSAILALGAVYWLVRDSDERFSEAARGHSAAGSPIGDEDR